MDELPDDVSPFEYLMEAVDRYEEAERRSQREPYVLSWRNPRNGETGFYKEDPAKQALPFYEKRVRDAAEEAGVEDSPLIPTGEEPDEDLIPDGGSRTKYYWSGENGVVYHSEVEDEMVDPFFGSVEEAEQYLETLADMHGKQQYEGMVLRKTGDRKVEEATEVLTEQSGLDQFAPDGGEEMFWPDNLQNYRENLEQFEDRHPPRYVDPQTPLNHDTVDYFPHHHFLQGIEEAAEHDKHVSTEEILEAADLLENTESIR